ncbi:MAG: hypothetical protein IJT72_07480 [Lachnospiraceae bacterium]|nr:hypothetical protein [Lachnospiraceae bacterium]
MRKKISLIMIMLLMLSLSACDKKDDKKTTAQDVTETTADSTETGVTEDRLTDDITTAENDMDDEEITTESEEEINERLNVYNEAIDAFIEEGMIPPYEEEYYETPSKNNQYAVCDVNDDGKNELLLRVNDADMASLAIYVFLYDDEELKQIGSFFASDETKFYSNRVVFEPISHGAETWGENFWGQNICVYDEELGKYEYKYVTDAWDSSIEDSWRGEDEVFPTEADKDGNGMVYWLIEFENDEYIEGEPLDDEAFNNKLDELTGSATEIDIPWEYATK